MAGRGDLNSDGFDDGSSGSFRRQQLPPTSGSSYAARPRIRTLTFPSSLPPRDFRIDGLPRQTARESQSQTRAMSMATVAKM